MEKQPAQKSYVFDKGYRDVGATFATTWGNAFAPVIKEMGRLGRIFARGKIISGIFTFFADLIVFGAITLFNVLLNTIISLFLIAVFLLAAPIVYTGFMLVWLADLIYRAINKINNKCPNCGHRSDIPVYQCKCGRRHTRLVPSSYGIFKRKCDCGTKIPTTFFNGRHKLASFCPHCGLDVRDGGKHVDVCIPVVGGPSAGKTCYINMAISELEKTAEAKHGLKFDYAFTPLNNYASTIDALRHHQLPDKTTDMRLQYYQFYLTPKKEKVKRLISLCDVAGEIYKDGDMMGQQIGFRYSDAFMVIIDPLSVQMYREEVERRFRISGYGASTMSIDAILSRLVTTLENMYGISAKTMLKTDVAIVFTKCDIPGLDEIIGNTAVARCMRSKNVSQLEASNIVCEAFLRKYGEDNFANSIKSKFHSVQFFTCSALGYDRNSAQYTPDGVEEPIYWIYNKIFG